MKIRDSCFEGSESNMHRGISLFYDQVYLHMFLPYCIILKSKCNSIRARDNRFLIDFYIKIISGQVILIYLNSKQLTYWRRVDAYPIEGCIKLRDSPYDQFLYRFIQYYVQKMLCYCQAFNRSLHYSYIHFCLFRISLNFTWQ